MNLQNAQIRLQDGGMLGVELPAFPDNPELLIVHSVTPRGRYYAVADNPVVSYGTDVLSYHEASIYEVIQR